MYITSLKNIILSTCFLVKWDDGGKKFTKSVEYVVSSISCDFSLLRVRHSM